MDYGGACTVVCKSYILPSMRKYRSVSVVFLLTVTIVCFLLIKDSKGSLDKTLFLVSPFYATDYNEDPGEVRLVDFKGKVYKSWKTKYQPMYGMFDAEGDLYVEEIFPTELSVSPVAGMTGYIEKFNKNGEVVWVYKNLDMHHDFDILPNQHILVPTAVKLSDSYAQRIKGGFFGKSKDSWSDTIEEIDENKKVVWKWSYEDHVRPEDYVLNPYSPRGEFTHTNSVKYYDTNPINGKPCILISSRYLSAVFLIDKESGNILWKSPKDIFSFQHDASLNNKDGTVMVFDNGFLRKQERPVLISRIAKIDLKTDKIVWTFYGGKTGLEMSAFSSSIMGGAQQLDNGDILATVAIQGKVIEISKDKKFIAQYINTYLGSPTTEGVPNNVLFKVRGYSFDFIKDKVLTGFWDSVKMALN
jgi:hypothetical protein